MNYMSQIVTESESVLAAAEKRRQRMRSVAIALGLGFLVMMFYAATIVHLGANVANRAI